MNLAQLTSRLNVSFSQKRTVIQVSKNLGLPQNVVAYWRKQWAECLPYTFQDVRLISPEVAEKIKSLAGMGDSPEQIAGHTGLKAEAVAEVLGEAGAVQGEPPSDPEVIEENVRLNKANQKLADRNRIERKAFRAAARYDNASAALLGELLGIMKSNAYHYDGMPEIDVRIEKGRVCGVIQLSDLHFNELISISGNRFDFSVASTRLRLLEREAVRVFKSYGVQEVLIAMTGDMLNSDRRLDEILSQATNRAKALFLAGDILQQFVASLRKNFRLTLAYVTGNESRNGDTISWTKAVATDNYDTLLFHMLRTQFAGVHGITFVEEEDNEVLVTINNCTFLLMHGHGKMENNVEQNVTKAIGRYAAIGILVDYVLLGHMHSARVGDFCARSASLAGSNAYSSQGLNLIGRASQNLFLVDDERRIHGIKVDLQHTEDVTDPYPIDERLTEYNAKSAEKARIHGFAPYKVGC